MKKSNSLKKSNPVRSCIICKKKNEKRELLRFVKKDKFIFDPLQKLEGRGYYVCLNCLQKGKMKQVDRENIKEQLFKQILNFLQLGWRSRQIKIGLDDVLKEIKKGRKGYIILAKDFSERSKRKLFNAYQGEVLEFSNKSTLGEALGKREVGLIFIPYNNYGSKLKDLLRNYQTLEGGNDGCQK